ncbi:PTS sugar transporter subunit IIA [Planctomycetota bacterium]
MDLSNILLEECVKIGTKARDKRSILKEIAKLARKSPVLEKVSEEKILKALDEREDLGSTGFGEGIAIPHCALDEVDRFIAGILTAPQGVDFDSLDGEETLPDHHRFIVRRETITFGCWLPCPRCFVSRV